MRKRLCVFLFLIVVLLELCACKTQKQIESFFYVSDGILQNTHVLIAVTTQELVAPVTELSYTLYEFSEYGINIPKHLNGTFCSTLLEVYGEEGWKEAPFSGCGVWDVLETGWGGGNPADFATIDFKMEFGAYEPDDEDYRRYAYLTPGVYRLKMKCYFYESGYMSENIENVNFVEAFAVAYFTVVP